MSGLVADRQIVDADERDAGLDQRLGPVFRQREEVVGERVPRPELRVARLQQDPLRELGADEGLSVEALGCSEVEHARRPDEDVERQRFGGGRALDEVDGRIDVRAGVDPEVQPAEVVAGAAGDRADPLECHPRIPGIRDHPGPDRSTDVDDLRHSLVTDPPLAQLLRRQPRSIMAKDTISILDGSTFLVSDLRGDIDASPDQAHGFFFRDTRFLSRWTLTANGSPLNVLSTDENQYFTAQFFLVPPTGTVNDNPTVSIIRKRSIGDGFHEDVTVINHGGEPLEVELRLEAGADFADLFEVKDALAKKGESYRRVEDGTLVLGYRRGDFVRETRIGSSAPAEVDEGGLTLRPRIEPHGEWSSCILVQPVTDHRVPIKYDHAEDTPRPDIGMSLDEFLARAPKLETDWDSLEHVYERSLIDLAALRFTSDLFPGAALPAAGLPWFMTVFGRDSLITSIQAVPFVPELAETTLRVLAARQGTKIDDFRDEEPGKILHEIRFGELVHFGERPHSPYYGSADATPLFLGPLEETHRWTGDDALV